MVKFGLLEFRITLKNTFSLFVWIKKRVTIIVEFDFMKRRLQMKDSSNDCLQVYSIASTLFCGKQAPWIVESLNSASLFLSTYTIYYTSLKGHILNLEDSEMSTDNKS